MPTTIEVIIWIKADPRKVFESWIRPEQFVGWFQHSARVFASNQPTIDKPQASSGDQYEWKLAHGHTSRGVFTHVDYDNHVVEFSFGSGEMRTLVRMEASEGGTLLKLTHIGCPPEDRADVQSGWTFYLTNLKAFHEHGVDLREHSPERIRMGVCNI